MKLKIRKVITYEFDVDAERSRINKIFKGVEREHMLKVLELFEAGKFRECGVYIDGLGQAEGGYPEAEHVGVGLGELIQMGCEFQIRQEAKELTSMECRGIFRDYAEEFTEFKIL